MISITLLYKVFFKNIVKIFFTRKSYFSSTFLYREHIKKDLMHYSALIGKIVFVIFLVKYWIYCIYYLLIKLTVNKVEMKINK